jgi:exodeoxyribonuclease V alpha subunit
MNAYFSGRVTSVVFDNAAQSFYVVKMILDSNSKATVTVRGTIPGLSVKIGSWFGFEGKWGTHQTYGRQIVISKAPVIQGKWDTDTAMKLLTGHGVGEALCQGLYEHFGEELLDVLGDKDRLQEVPAVTEFTAMHIISRWHAIRAMFQALDFLSDLNLPKQKVDQIWAEFGGEAEAVLSEDPWALVRIDGITFDQADEVSRKTGLDPTSPKRLKGAILYTCKQKRGMGHLYLDIADVLLGIRSYIPNVTNEEVARTIKELHTENLLYVDNKTRKGVTAIYEPWFYEVEKESAQLLADRVLSAAIDDPEDIQSMLIKLATVGPKTLASSQDPDVTLVKVARQALEEWSEQSKMKLTDQQLEGAVNALVHPVAILTGLPGSGKTTCSRVIVKVLQDAGIPFLLVAPTGIAAKRLSSVTGAEASTIHRAFGAKGAFDDNDRDATYAGIVGASSGDIGGDGSSERWGYTATNPHPARVVIVDESSMVDQSLLFRLLTCTSKHCRLFFVGDAAQLPSVGPGNVLRDMISSGLFPVVDLREIFRQEEASDIVLAAHAIQGGITPTFTKGSKDFTFVELRDETKIQEALTATVKKLYDKRVNFQVLSPRHSGVLGVTNLNLRIRDLLNPKQPGLREMRLGAETIREGDRVMVSKNNYRYEIFNGDVGKVVRLDLNTKQIEIKIWGPPTIHVRMPFKEAPGYLRMAYCVTVHKSQGQEYDVILMPWVNSYHHQLQRNLIYTAITRAKKKVILIGHPEAMGKAVMNNKVDARNTLFPDRLLLLLR